jgi:2-keto-4-pentenoate hydratase
MLNHLAQRASDLLWNCWNSGQRLADGLPPDIRPQTREEGYAIQALLEHRSSVPIFGWKIAATSQAGQLHIRVDRPIAGRILAERVFESGAEVPFGCNSMHVAEPEFAFRMARDLVVRDRPYTVDEVLQAVGSLHPAIEIPDSRYQDFATVGAAQLIADDACAHYFVLGPAAPNSWRSLDLVAHKVTVAVPGKREHGGSGAAVLGDPRIALTWLANELSAIATPIKAGQVVSTGTCAAPMSVSAGDLVVADMGILGKASVRFGIN